MPLEMIAILSLTLISFLIWLCFLQDISQQDADHIHPMQMDLKHTMEMVCSNDCSDKASLKQVIKTDASNCTQLKTVLYMINMNGTVNSLFSYSDPYQQYT